MTKTILCFFQLKVSAEVVWAVEVAVGRMSSPAVVVEDVCAGPVCGCFQIIQTIQLFEKPFKVGDGAGDPRGCGRSCHDFQHKDILCI